MKITVKFSIAMIMISAFAGFFFLGLAASSFIKLDFSNNYFTSPFVSNDVKEKPLQQYSIENLQKRQYLASSIVIEKILEETSDYTSYQFSYTSTSKRMTGQLNLPIIRAYGKSPKTIIMLRGYLSAEDYQTGMGTKNAAASFAKNGFVTVAPDFFGVAGSEKENEDVWEARFIKPINVIELIKSIRSESYLISDELILNELQTQSIKQLNKLTSNELPIGLWAHSNGGQIALTVLEVLSEPIPSTLWAPMIAPFPYSILYFGWDEADEGKEQRKWISLFEEDYNVFDFSVTQHTVRLRGPIQIQHGSSDDQVLTAWVEALVKKLEKEKINYIEYPNADHNLQPVWNTAVQKDLKFFTENL